AKPTPNAPEQKGSVSEQTPVPTPPQHQRPRTLAEAMQRNGMQGARTLQNGGVGRISMDSSLDAIQTVYGDYDREFIEAVQQRWFDLLADREVTQPGKVVL